MLSNDSSAFTAPYQIRLGLAAFGNREIDESPLGSIIVPTSNLSKYIVLVLWRIRPDKETDFLMWWKESMKSRPEGLIEEYLSKVEADETNTWNLDHSDATLYVNVGLWKDKSYWKTVIYLPKKQEEFEASFRQRVWLSVIEMRSMLFTPSAPDS